MVVIIDVPPADISGNCSPVTGRSPTTYPVLVQACRAIQVVDTPAVGGMSRALAVMAGLRAPGVAQADQFRNGHWVYGAIDTEFRRLGFLYPGGPPTIGEPNSDELNANNGGKWQAFGFDTNRILWNANVDSGRAHQIGGLILQKWLSNGDERGRLGYPITSESQANGGKFNHFQGGSIYFRNGATAAFIVQGEILRYWRDSNWENGEFGFPVSDEYDFNGGKKQDFQRGSLYWNVNYREAVSTSGQQYPKPSTLAADVPRIALSDVGDDVTVLRQPQSDAEAPTVAPTPDTTVSPTPAPSPSSGTTSSVPMPTTGPVSTVPSVPEAGRPASETSATPTPCAVPKTTTAPETSPTPTSSTPTPCIPVASSGTNTPTTSATTASPQNRPFPAQVPSTDTIAAECSQGITAPTRRIACTKNDWVVYDYTTSTTGRRVVAGSIPYTLELSATYGNTTTRSGSANWDLVAKITVGVGNRTLARGASAKIVTACPSTKCGTGR